MAAQDRDVFVVERDRRQRGPVVKNGRVSLWAGGLGFRA